MFVTDGIVRTGKQIGRTNVRQHAGTGRNSRSQWTRDGAVLDTRLGRSGYVTQSQWTCCPIALDARGSRSGRRASARWTHFEAARDTRRNYVGRRARSQWTRGGVQWTHGVVALDARLRQLKKLLDTLTNSGTFTGYKVQFDQQGLWRQTAVGKC